VVGLDERADEDRLKALGAAAASSGAVAMFHAVGVTPEAPTLEAALGGRTPARKVSISVEELSRARSALSTGCGELGAVSVGTPHMSQAELRRLAGLVEGQRTAVPFYVNTSRHLADQARVEATLDVIEAFGATVVTDTCTYVTPIMEKVSGDVMTNSGKWAYYAPANLGVGVRLGSLTECVASAVAGEVVELEHWA